MDGFNRKQERKNKGESCRWQKKKRLQMLSFLPSYSVLKSSGKEDGS